MPVVELEPDTLADQCGVERQADVTGDQHGDASSNSGCLLSLMSGSRDLELIERARNGVARLRERPQRRHKAEWRAM